PGEGDPHRVEERRRLRALARALAAALAADEKARAAEFDRVVVEPELHVDGRDRAAELRALARREPVGAAEHADPGAERFERQVVLAARLARLAEPPVD